MDFPPLPDIPFCGPEEASRRREAYAVHRLAYRAANPHRNFAITPAAVYLAPPELRVAVNGAPP